MSEVSDREKDFKIRVHEIQEKKHVRVGKRMTWVSPLIEAASQKNQTTSNHKPNKLSPSLALLRTHFIISYTT